MRKPLSPRRRRDDRLAATSKSPDVAYRELVGKPVAELAEHGLTLRAVNILESYDVLTVRDLLQKSREELLQMTNLGEKTIEDLRVALLVVGIEPPTWRSVLPQPDWSRLW